MLEDREPVAIPIVYLGVEDAPLLYANQFVIQYQQNEFILTVGQLAPPILLGTEEERRQQARELTYVPVKVVARFALTRTRLEELVKVLAGHLERYDQERQREGDEEG